MDLDQLKALVRDVPDFPQEGVLFSGDLVEFGATPYTGDAYLRDWPATLDRIADL